MSRATPALRQPVLPQLCQHDAELLATLPTPTLLIGVDEVGRGSCIGPVSAAAVAWWPKAPHCEPLATLNDSKQMRATDRAACCNTLIQHTQHAYAEASQHEVDTLNVYQASLLAASRAILILLETLSTPVAVHLILDGKALLPEHYRPHHHPKCLSFTQQALIQGDGKSFCIAAASVIAKHTRDTLINTWAAEDPRYGWATNMGYPTPAHKAALAQYGPSPFHRKHYKAVVEAQQQHLALH